MHAKGRKRPFEPEKNDGHYIITVEISGFSEQGNVGEAGTGGMGLKRGKRKSEGRQGYETKTYM